MHQSSTRAVQIRLTNFSLTMNTCSAPSHTPYTRPLRPTWDLRLLSSNTWTRKTTRFDFRKMAHLVLYDFEIIIEFPPGCTALLPSATVSHGNTATSRSETRYSLTQYCNVPLFRWVRNGFKPVSALTRREKAASDCGAEDHCAEILCMFSKLEEIVADRASCLL